MNAAHIHLLVNHFPIVGVLLSSLVLIIGLLFKQRVVLITAMGLLIFSSLTGVVAYFSGDEAEDALENVAGVNEAQIHTHETWAKYGVGFTAALGVATIIALVMLLKYNEKANAAIILVLLLAFALFGLLSKVGNTGGLIRHPEINGNVQTISPADGGTGDVAKPDGDKDED